MIREAKDSDAEMCALLFYSADSRLSSYLFAADKDICISVLKELFTKPKNMFSKDYCFVDEDDEGNIVGAIWVVKGNEKKETEIGVGRYFLNVMKYVPKSKIFTIIARSVMLAVHSDGINRDEFYIIALAVAPEHRNKGIASRLLKKAEEIAHKSGFKKMSLLVEIGNDTAKKSYIKKGYTVANRTLVPQKYADHVLFSFEKMVREFA